MVLRRSVLQFFQIPMHEKYTDPLPAPEFTPVFLVESVLLIFLFFCVVLLCVFMF
jgi:hypothetical protein